MHGREAQEQDEQREAVEVRVLEAIADGRPLPVILEEIASALEHLVAGWHASILLVSPDGTVLRHGAAPSLPAAFVQATDGARIGPVAGSCGTAAYRRAAVVVSDIAQDPLWAQWRDVALANGLRACWSVPVIDQHDTVLATFAVYHGAPAHPDQRHLALLQRYAHLVRIALQHDRTEREVRASEEWFRSIFRDAAFGLAVADPSGHLTYTNHAYCQMVGYDQDELSALTVQDLTHPEDWPANQEGLREVMSGARPSFILEKRYVRRDGAPYWVRVTISARRDVDGRLIDTISFVEDISQRRRDEEALRQHALLLQMASRIGRLGAWWYDVARREPHLSPEARMILGHRDDDALEPATLAAQVEPEDLARVRAAVRRCISDGTPFDEEARVTRTDGIARWIRTFGEAVDDASGARARLQGALQDITDRKLLEQHSLRSQRIESIGTLAGGIAHDLNNVLTPIAMGVSLLRADERDPARDQVLGLIEASAARAADMVRQVLAFARGAEGPRRAVAPATLVTDVASLLADTLPKHITLELELAADVPTVEADATQLQQVLLNLCVNARDAMPDGGHLRLSVHRMSEEVCLRVEDTGEGMTPDMLDKIFDPFFTTKPLGQGTGLGLSTSLGIVRSHGGRIDVTSTPAHGTRFDVILPASPHSLEQAPPSPPVPLSPSTRATVLLVEDERAVRLVSRQVLETAGFQVIEAASGEEALREFEAHRDEIGVVLTDMMMPGMAGPALVQTLRARAATIPIVGMSGLGGGADFDDATGLAAFLPKPFTPAALCATLRAALDGQAPR